MDTSRTQEPELSIFQTKQNTADKPQTLLTHLLQVLPFSLPLKFCLQLFSLFPLSHCPPWLMIVLWLCWSCISWFSKFSLQIHSRPFIPVVLLRAYSDDQVRLWANPFLELPGPLSLDWLPLHEVISLHPGGLPFTTRFVTPFISLLAWVLFCHFHGRFSPSSHVLLGRVYSLSTIWRKMPGKPLFLGSLTFTINNWV